MSSFAEKELSQWWRRRAAECPALVQMTLPESLREGHPRAMLRFLATTDDGQSHLRQLEANLSRNLKQFQSSNGSKYSAATDEKKKILTDLLVNLASLLMWRNAPEEALNLLEQALQFDPSDCLVEIDILRTRRQLAALQRQREAMKALERERKSLSISSSSSIVFEPVERYTASTLSLADFYRLFNNINKQESLGKPVVFPGLAKDSFPSPFWTREWLMEKLGDSPVPLRRRVPFSPEWAQLENEKTLPFSEFLSSLLAEGKDPIKNLTLFDYQLPLHHPSLLDNFKMPAAFAFDLLQLTEDGTMYRDSWPSLFVGGKSIGGSLHVDTFGSNFWMIMLEGKKRWKIIDPRDLALLYPRYDSSLDPSFAADFFNLNLKEYPLLGKVRGWEVILEPGDVLFVPAGCPHQVRNDEFSIAVSGNFVNFSNVEMVIEETKGCDGILNERARELGEAMERIWSQTKERIKERQQGEEKKRKREDDEKEWWDEFHNVDALEMISFKDFKQGVMFQDWK